MSSILNQNGSRLGIWGYRLLALLIAIALWYATAAEKREPQSEKVVEAAITYGRPDNMVILNSINNVRVGVRGNLREIRTLRPFEVDVQVDISEAQAGPVTVTLTPEQILLPSPSLEVQSIEPKTFTLQLDVLEERRLPVEVDFVGEPGAGSIVTGVSVIPETVLVSGPSTLLSSVESLLTQTVDLDRHALTFEKDVTLVSPDPAIRVLRPQVVTVQVKMEEPPPPGGRRNDNDDEGP